ncbi:tRNA (cytidine(34)-2'-O)-methyltransferase [Sphingomonas sp. S1-29]|uniref:tRNA (cytidine(34)-2'-O)-methyltransferase n=1 Tax=Sphingomonas sp. S1-29 TaxID=2991074 RepID=UPI00223F76AD|nr:TrmH family RNA methyltransferase [Sphingomonas sp. S1-29]UZK69189.1 tRNA (cytidine(34)-2'-O)-methyltransferase [Sphingomonas sp. S1-29]
MRIALFEPDIAGNVGAILRTAACLNVAVDLIEPMGFTFSDRALARAGMDYARSAQVTRHADFAAFAAALQGRLVLATTKGATRLDAAAFKAGDTLLFGSEGTGVPDHVHDRAEARVVVPMMPGMRSLNVGVSVALVLGAALQQTGGWPAPPPA